MAAPYPFLSLLNGTFLMPPPSLMDTGLQSAKRHTAWVVKRESLNLVKMARHQQFQGLGAKTNVFYLIAP